ncbi:DUF6333 family protein [Streptomyces inhibens]|uniref:DUF6333 family protein n=1 Tax=Streptomyces inhibens TaxID=2293571 RepID=UPI0037AAB633
MFSATANKASPSSTPDPRPPGSSTDAADLPAHDPAVARRFAESFGTVDTILEELGTVPATADVAAGTRADLELVRVGCTSSPGMRSPNSPSDVSPPSTTTAAPCL